MSKTKLLRILLLISFVCQSVWAADGSQSEVSLPNTLPEATSASAPSFDINFPKPEEIFDHNPVDPNSTEEQAFAQLEPYAGTAVDASKAWTQEMQSRLKDLLELRAKVFTLAATWDETHAREEGSIAKGVEATDAEIGNGNVSVPAPGFGRMKLTIVRGRRIAVFFENKTRRAFVIYEKNDLTEKDLEVLIAGYHIWGDDNKGRNVTTVELDHGSTEVGATSDFEKATSAFQRQWWADQFTAKIVKPDKGDVVLGIGAGLLQMGVAGGVMALSHYGFGQGDMTWAPVLMTGGFGTFFGIFGKSYFNLTNKGDPELRAWKSAPAAWLFSSMMLFLTGDGANFWSIKVQAASLISIYAAKKFVSLPWNMKTILRSELRENSGTIRLPFLPNVSLDRQQVERTRIALIPLGFKVADSFLKNWEHLPKVNVWSKFIPHIEQMPILNQILHSNMPYFQVLGVLVATYIYMRYLKKLNNRPVVEGQWPEEKAEKVKRAYDEERGKIKRAINVPRYPAVIKDYTISKVKECANWLRNPTFLGKALK